MAFKEVKKPYRNQIRIPFDVIKATTQNTWQKCHVSFCQQFLPILQILLMQVHLTMLQTLCLYTNLAPFWDHPM